MCDKQIGQEQWQTIMDLANYCVPVYGTDDRRNAANWDFSNRVTNLIGKMFRKYDEAVFALSCEDVATVNQIISMLTGDGELPVDVGSFNALRSALSE